MPSVALDVAALDGDIGHGAYDVRGVPQEPGTLCISKWVNTGLYQSSVGMVYYERYEKDGAYSLGIDGFLPVRSENGGYVRDTASTLCLDGDGQIVREDGYALVFLASEFESFWNDGVATYGDWTWNLGDAIAVGDLGHTLADLDGGLSRIGLPGFDDRYVMVCLPIAVITEGVPDKEHFWQRITCENSGGGATFHFNPHFAKTVRGTEAKPAELVIKDFVPGSGTYYDWDAVVVRTPRHLYSLSRFQFADESYVYDDKKFYWQQELDLDYATYEWRGADGFNPVKAREEDPYWSQPSIGIELGRDREDEVQVGAIYDGGGHVIRNVFYDVPDGKLLQYLGLFKFVDDMRHVRYEVPDDIALDVPNDLDPVDTDGWCDAIKVGTLAGGAFWASDCSVSVKRLTVTSSNADIYVGGMFGYVNRPWSLSATVESLFVIRTGSVRDEMGYWGNTYGGGLAGLYLYSMDNCSSEVGTLYVEGVGIGQHDTSASGAGVYAGGLVGRSTKNTGTADWVAVNSRPMALSGCHATVGTLSAVGFGDDVYAGGLAGWCNGMVDCHSVVTDGLYAEGSLHVSAGGLAGGSDSVERCTATSNLIDVESIGPVGYDNIVCGGGLLGTATDIANHTIPWKHKPNIHVTDSTSSVACLESDTDGACLGGLVGYSIGCMVYDLDDIRQPSVLTFISIPSFTDCYSEGLIAANGAGPSVGPVVGLNDGLDTANDIIGIRGRSEWLLVRGAIDDATGDVVADWDGDWSDFHITSIPSRAAVPDVCTGIRYGVVSNCGANVSFSGAEPYDQG